MSAALISAALCVVMIVGLVVAAPSPKLKLEFLSADELPVDENILQEAIEKLRAIVANKTLSWRERRREMDSVLEALPPAASARLPLPPGFERLPAPVYAKIRTIHTNAALTLRERSEQIRHIMETLPWEQRMRVLEAEFPALPPSGFEEVLAPTIYRQLLAIHQNTSLSVEEKKARLDSVMRRVPADQIQRLPLPEAAQHLDAEEQQHLRQLMYNFEEQWNERFRQVRQFIRSLPREQRQYFRALPFPEFQRLSAAVLTRPNVLVY